MTGSLTSWSGVLSARRIPLVALYLAAYVTLDWVSYIHAIAPLGITPWNPPPGLSLVFLMRYGLRNAPWLAVAALLAEVLVRGTPAPLPWLALSSILLAGGYSFVAWVLLGPLRFQPDFRTLRDASVFTSVVAVATASIAVAYVGTLYAAGVLPEDSWLPSVARFWIGDLIGIIVTTPFLLIMTRRDGAWSGLRTWEAMAQAASIGVVLWTVFASGLAAELHLFYLLFLPLIWVAMRHGLPGTTAATLLIQLGLIFALELEGSSSTAVLQFQFLLLALSVTGLILGAAISERRQTEFRLREKQLELDRSLRLAAASELASALAHELNQPLSAISNYVRSLQIMTHEGAGSVEALGPTVDKVVQEAARASGVVRRLRDFFRAGSMQIEPLDVEAVLRTAVAVQERRLDRHLVRWQIECAQGLPRVDADRVQFEIVLHNLVANAIDSLKEIAADRRLLRLTAEPYGERFVRVAVIDSGPGIPAQVAAGLLHPMSSTKPQGMGLGLAISRSIVEAHGGRLVIETERSNGIVRFTLPVAA